MKHHRKLILLLIDGVSADYVVAHGRHLPYLSGLMGQGTTVTRLLSPVPAVSMPGRASMLTGVGAARHGIFGNNIIGDQGFRRPVADDLTVPTIAGAAKAAGLDVASIGFGLVRPQDTDVYVPPWWMRNWVRGDRFAKVPADAAQRVQQIRDPDGRLAGLPDVGQANADGAPDRAAASHRYMAGLAGDRRNLHTVAHLACSDTPPDLILSEVLITDTVQHDFGYESEAAHWSIAVADMMLGAVVHALERAGRRDDYVVAVASDHGHGPIDTAIYPEVVIPGTVCEAEGGTLNVAMEDAGQRRHIADCLAAFGAVEQDDGHLPQALRGRVATFTAPHRHSFEERPADAPADEPTGTPRYISSHGLRPGDRADDRFCVFAGPGVPHAVVDAAEADQLAPSLAAVLGVPLPTSPAAPISAVA